LVLIFVFVTFQCIFYHFRSFSKPIKMNEETENGKLSTLEDELNSTLSKIVDLIASDCKTDFNKRFQQV